MAAALKGYFQATTLNTAKDLPTAIGQAVPTGSTFCIVQAESQNLRWRDDGTSPTASVGNVIAAGESVVFAGKQLSTVKLIEVTASAKANISFYKN
jgi:hypothetical protein